MPLPSDRESLLALAAETEQVVEQTASAHNSQIARQHAVALLKLGRIRQQLGEAREAERILQRAETAAWALNTPDGRELAATAKVGQAAFAMKEGRNQEALAMIERMVKQFGGVPEFRLTPRWPAVFGMWLALLEEAKQYQRLYEVAGIALDRLDPSDSADQRAMVGKVYAWQARSAEQLGRKAEAVELHEKAIAILEAEEEDSTSEYLLHRAVANVAGLLSDLDRDEEASLAYERVVERLSAKQGLWARGMVWIAKLWLRFVRPDASTNPHQN